MDPGRRGGTDMGVQERHGGGDLQGKTGKVQIERKGGSGEKHERHKGARTGQREGESQSLARVRGRPTANHI